MVLCQVSYCSVRRWKGKLEACAEQIPGYHISAFQYQFRFGTQHYRTYFEYPGGCGQSHRYVQRSAQQGHKIDPPDCFAQNRRGVGARFQNKSFVLVGVTAIDRFTRQIDKHVGTVEFGCPRARRFTIPDDMADAAVVGVRPARQHDNVNRLVLPVPDEQLPDAAGAAR